jgi:hypothetical protein
VEIIDRKACQKTAIMSTNVRYDRF